MTDFDGKARETLAQVNIARNPYQSKWQHEWHPIATALRQAYEDGRKDLVRELTIDIQSRVDGINTKIWQTSILGEWRFSPIHHRQTAFDQQSKNYRHEFYSNQCVWGC
jgi:hypothetical protein